MGKREQTSSVQVENTNIHNNPFYFHARFNRIFNFSSILSLLFPPSAFLSKCINRSLSKFILAGQLVAFACLFSEIVLRAQFSKRKESFLTEFEQGNIAA